jgi:hypothetical protein
MIENGHHLSGSIAARFLLCTHSSLRLHLTSQLRPLCSFNDDITMPTTNQGEVLVQDKVFSPGLGVALGSFFNDLHRTTLPLASQGMLGNVILQLGLPPLTHACIQGGGGVYIILAHSLVFNDKSLKLGKNEGENTIERKRESSENEQNAGIYTPMTETSMC